MSKENGDKENDYEFARETLYDMICKGREGMEEMLEVAKESEHPRAYEVLAKLMKDTADVSNQLLRLQQQKKDLEKADTPKPKELPAGQTNVFIGSTTDLQRMLQDVNNEKEVTAEYERITPTDSTDT